MFSEEMNALLEMQYLAIQELMDEQQKFPTRDEVIERVLSYIGKPQLTLVQ